MNGLKFRTTWYNYASFGRGIHLHVEALVPGASPTVLIRASISDLGEGRWEIYVGELTPLFFQGDRKAVRRRALHRLLELLNGAVATIADELGQNS